MKSNTKISKQTAKKKNSEIVETILLAKKHSKWREVASVLAGPRRNFKEVNLNFLNKDSKEGEILIVPGKVLSLGEVNKKIKVAALNFSKKAREKLNKAGCETYSVLEEIKSNPDGKGIKILR